MNITQNILSDIVISENSQITKNALAKQTYFFFNIHISLSPLKERRTHEQNNQSFVSPFFEFNHRSNFFKLYLLPKLPVFLLSHLQKIAGKK